MVKNYKILSLFLVLLTYMSAYSQQAGRIYLSSARTGRVYDISDDILTNPSSTAIRQLPTPLSLINVSGANRLRTSNLAIGYDAVAGNNTQLAFFHSDTESGTPLYKNGTAVQSSSGATVNIPDDIGGIGTNNVIGPYFGYTYGFKRLDKSLYRINPNPGLVGTITGDADWNNQNSTAFGTDTFYDYQNNIYTFINRGSNRFLYKISIANLIATKVVQLANSTTPSADDGIQGMAYLNNIAYIATITAPSNGNSRITVRGINLTSGAITTLSIYEFSGTTANIDLASVDYFVPFQFVCGEAAFISGNPFTPNYPSTRTVRVPITNIYTPGTYPITISGTNFNTVTQNFQINANTTYIDVPVTYTGGGAAGPRNLTISLNTTSCNIAAEVELDTDRDGLADSVDLDDDNDGILDCVENGLAGASFANNNTFNKIGTALQGSSSNIIQLTADSQSQDGKLWSIGKIDFTKNFTMNFDAYLGTKDSNGADGIAIVFHNAPTGSNTTTVSGGTGIGLGARGIPNGLVLELDTWNNGSSIGDIPEDHGHIWDSDNQGTGLTTAIALPNLEDGNWHPVVIRWNAASQTIIYTVDGITAGTLTTPNFASTYFGADKVYFGYTASTGGSSNQQQIRINDFCSLPIELDTDNDGDSNHLDVDSDGDGCPDAIEGSENVKYNQVHSLSLPTSDANYNFRGQIKVLGNGTSPGSPSQIISTKAEGYGVPLLVNSANGNHTNVAGVADNTDGTADVGQGIGNSQNTALSDCKCYRNPSSTGTDNPTKHGITSFNRAGATNSNWPMVRNNGWTALEADTKAFVLNRMPSVTTGANAGEPLSGGNPAITSPVLGMMYYDTTNDCLKINVDGTRSGWKCFDNQSCPLEN